MIRHTSWYLCSAVTSLACVFISVASVNAQNSEATKDIDTAGLVIEATAGWDGTIDDDGAIPIAMLLNNYSDEDIDGQVILTEPFSKREVEIGEVYIGAGATRRFAAIQALPDWYDCFVSIRNGEEVLWRRELALNTGQEFFSNVNFVLVVDEGGRTLSLPGALKDASSITSEQMVAPEEGRPIRCLSVKSWQVPDHFGPLTSVQAIVFPEESNPDALNRAQWDAVAKWMCQGGTVFANQESKELIDRLIAASVLDGRDSTPKGEFVVHPMGLGAIFEYPGPLFATEGTNIRKAIAEVAPQLRKHTIYGMVNAIDLRRRRGGQADWNRAMVIGFFLCYLFLSGLVALMLFRLNRRKIAIYIIAVVAGASFAAALLGMMLRYSQGDLRWSSVTQVGAGGAVQVAKIGVQSAGARNTQVAVTGDHSDLQSTGVHRRWYHWRSQRDSFSAFSFRPNLAKDVENVFQTDVPMTPWGRASIAGDCLHARNTSG